MDGKRAQFFMNPNVGTCLTGPARDKAQGEAPQLDLAPLPREKLPEGLEARILMPVHKVISDPHLARAALAFAHGMVSLEISQRFPPWSKLEKSWARALDAFSAARPPG